MTSKAYFLGALFSALLISSCTDLLLDSSTLEDIISTGGGLHEIFPSSQYEIEGCRKAHQFSNLLWTPVNPIPQVGGKYYYQANVERKGMLYAECCFQDKRVGYDLSLYTFLTALNNPYSLLYTENTNDSFSISAYGIDYHGDGNSGAYMGVACNSFVYMVLGSIIPYSSYETATIAKNKGIVTVVAEKASQSLHLLDILQTPGHMRVITRLWADDQNVIKRIEISEAVGSGVHSIIYSSEEFDAWINSTDYSIYRFNESYSISDVTPLPNMDYGLTSSYSVPFNNDLCCTFAGDFASFGEDEFIEINYNKRNYDKLEIYRDGILIDSISLSDDSTVHSVNINSHDYGLGTFKARLIGSDCSSAFTNWEVLGIDLQLGSNMVNFECLNGTPIYWGWYNRAGWACWKQEVSCEEGQKYGSIETSHKDVSYPLFKLYIQGKYGRIAVKKII